MDRDKKSGSDWPMAPLRLLECYAELRASTSAPKWIHRTPAADIAEAPGNRSVFSEIQCWQSASDITAVTGLPPCAT
ncbi:Uncharacterised protein [Mycobacteroides abscessus subsp. abscessus]|nr:Uncharacterised protein [Mycobacteroides abscessus subsp. abscessus]